MPADAAASSPSVPELQHRIELLEAVLHARTAGLDEALRRESAVAGVLRVINSSPGNLAPVFDVMLEKATVLCEADAGVFALRRDDGRFDWASVRGFASMPEFAREPVAPHPESGVGRLVRGETTVHILDSATGSAYQSGDLGRRAIVELGGARTQLCVALRKGDLLLGAFVIWRREVRPFSESQIALLQNFAMQAVVAIENARLLDEQREGLEQQTATADILRIISQSPTNVQPVLDVVVKAAQRFCGAEDVTIGLRDGEFWKAAAHVGPMEAGIGQPIQLNRQSVMGRSILGAETVQVADIEEVDSKEFSTALELAHRFGWRAAAAAPMHREGVAAGAILLRRPKAGAFTERQIDLLQTFAAQAVIAFENVRLFTELRQRTDDLTESLEYQTATSDVLQVISRSTFDLQPVLDTLSATAARLCGAELSFMTRRDGDAFRFVTAVGATSETTSDAIRLKQEVLDQHLFRPGRDTITGRVVAEQGVVQIVDLAADAEYALTALTTVGKIKTLLGVPLMREGEVIGTMSLARQRVEPFTDKQIQLVRTFADQAVIAMENARLLTEQREALARQQATSEVLQVINSSLGQVAPVFDALLEKATSLCEAAFGILWTYDGENFHAAAFREVPPAYAEYLRNPPPLTPETPLGRIAAGESVVHILDLAAQALEHNPLLRQAVELGGFRTILGVALSKEGMLLGAITIYRQEIRQFSDKQVALLQNFAAQAVIAMDNARLLGEQREALEQQTATAEVLQVINSSPGNLGPVFEAMLDKGLNLCSAAFGVLWTYDGEYIHAAAIRGATTVYTEFLTSGPHRPGDTLHGRLLRGSEVEHIADMADSDDYRSGEATPRALVDLGGGRSRLAVALRKEGVFLGDIVIYRREVRPFSDKEIALLQNFAAQAVIAMENARLLTEQREALDQQTATAEVLQVINSSPGDIVPVFATILEKAHALCGVAYGSLQLYDGEKFRAVAVHGLPQALADLLRDGYVPGPTHPVRALLAGEDSVQIPDMAGMGDASSVLRTSGLRTALFVALRKDDQLLGQIVAARNEIRPFTDKETSLLQNFAQHAVIAIENARLLGELRESLDQQTATAEILQVISTSPGELQPVFEAILANAGRLCAAQFGSAGLRVEGGFHFHATLNMPSAFIDYLRANDPLPIVPGGAIEHMDRTGQVVHIADLQRDTGPGSRSEQRRVLAEAVGAKTMLWVPMLREGRVVGIINLFRTEVAPFSDQQIELVRGFAAQAVIAIENARLLNEVRRREQELSVTFEHMGDGVVMFDADQKLASWNRNFQEILDMPDDFLASRPPRDDYVRLLAQRGELGERDVEKEVARYRDRATRQWSAERTRPDGRVLEVRNNPVPGGGAVLIYSDITERKKAEAEIAAARDAAEAALERQTATADILGVISRSPTDAGPVFEAIARNAHRLCDAVFCGVVRYDGEWLHLAAVQGFSADEERGLRSKYPVRADDPSVLSARVVTSGRAQHIDDILADENYDHQHVSIDGFRRIFGVPMLRDGNPTGAIVVGWREQGTTPQSQIDLLTTFAAQAVIAVENVRLFTELSESLERQTATADILKVIASSPADMKPAFDAIAESAKRLLGGLSTTVWRLDGDAYRLEAFTPTTEDADRALREMSVLPKEQGDTLAPAATGRTVTEIPDTESGPAFMRDIARLRGFRACLAVSLAVEGQSIGFVNVTRREPGVFRPDDIELLKTFADQAVIAIENVRLFTELREALEQQTATADILRVISQSPTDVGPVLTAVARAALKFCGAQDAIVVLREGENWFTAAHEGPIETPSRASHRLTRGTAPGRAILDGKVVQIEDYRSAATAEFSEGREISARYGFRSVMAAPLLKDDVAIGAISLRRPEQGAYTANQVELLKSFAAQAVIAIENVRLFTELRDSLERLKAAQANLIQAEKMASLGQLTAGIAHEIKNPLNFVNNFAGLSSELLEELKQAVDALLAEPDEDKRAELQDTMDLLTGNLAKIVEHGRRADGIVKSMLSHSRGGTGDWQESNINALVEEALNLAYHGARAQDKDFNVTLERDFAPEAKPIEVVPQDVTRVFLNLFGNGFYATRKRHLGGADAGYRPTLRVSTRDLGEAVEVRVRDNGTGIHPEVRAKLFQPFFTTKPTGEGTGLGLSISYDIVTQQHGGTIEVESEPGSFTEFTVRLPRGRRVAQSRGA